MCKTCPSTPSGSFCSVQTNNAKLYVLMANLLYPAVHGTLLYTLMQAIVDSASLTDPNVMLQRHAEVVFLMCLVVHFAVDYLYTIINERKPDYELPQFLFDFVIVACLFLAGSVIPPKAIESSQKVGDLLSNPAVWLCVGKLAGACWEWWLRQRDGNRGKFGLLSDMYFFSLYFMLAFVFQPQGLGPVFVVLILDTAAYFFHDTLIYPKHPTRKSPAPSPSA